MKAKFALIGCGRISENHIDAIVNAKNAELAAVCDIEEDKAKNAAAKAGLAKWYTDAEDMLNNEKIDVCCILTPSGNHSECACLAARHGVNVLCEKPLDVTSEKMQKMIDSCKENNVKLGAVFQRRTFEAAVAVKEAVKSGSLGKLTLASADLMYYRDQEYYDSGKWRGTWELDGGGALMNQGVHGVDMLDNITGGIKSVVAVCSTLCRDIDVEDTAAVLVKFKNGALGTVKCGTAAYPGHDTVFTLCGDRGSVKFGDKGIYEWSFADESIKKPETSGDMGGINCAYKSDNRGHLLQIEDMAEAVLQDRPPMISGEDAMRSVKIILAIYESARTGKEVFIDEI